MIENDPPAEMSEAELIDALRSLGEGKQRSDRFESLLSEAYDRLRRTESAQARGVKRAE